MHGLTALLEFQASRTAARTGPDGEPVLLKDQNRARWNRMLITRGTAALTRADAVASGPRGRTSSRRPSPPATRTPTATRRPTGTASPPSTACSPPARRPRWSSSTGRSPSPWRRGPRPRCRWWTRCPPCRSAARLPPAAQCPGRSSGPPGPDGRGAGGVRPGGWAGDQRAGAGDATEAGGGGGRLRLPRRRASAHRVAQQHRGRLATRVRKTVTDAVPCGFGSALRRSSSGSTAEPRFLTVRTPTSRSRSRAFSFLRLKGSRSVIS